MRSRTLLTGLVNHLAPALHRLKLHMDIRNPLLAQMEEEHPELMEIARHAIPMMEEEAGMPVPDDEVAYIAIHIGAALTEAGGDRPAARVLVACPTGLGTSRLLASRLRRSYERIRVVGVVSSLALTAQEILRRSADFVVSTVPLSPLPVPVVVVSVFLTAADRAQIDAVLAGCSVHHTEVPADPAPLPFPAVMAEIHRRSGLICDLLTEFHLQENVSAVSIEQLADAAAHLLLTEDAAAEEFAAELLRRENIAPTWAAPQMILLHGCFARQERARFDVMRLAHPLPYGGDAVQTALVMLVPAGEAEMEREILGHVAAQIADRPTFADILAHGDAAGIRRELEYVLEEHFREHLEQLL